MKILEKIKKFDFFYFTLISYLQKLKLNNSNYDLPMILYVIELKFDVLVSEKLEMFVLKSEAKNFVYVSARIPGMKPGLKLDNLFSFICSN